ETIKLANDLMDQKLRTYAEIKSDSKRKADDISRNNKQPFKKQNVVKAYNLGSAEKNTYEGNAPKSFVSTAFSFLTDIIPTPLDNHYDVELVDGKIVGINTIIRGCTLNILNHPFTIDLMLVELGSFDAIIGMDWLRRYNAMIMCDEKLVRVPFGKETLVFHGAKSYIRRESRLTVISCSKVQEYRAKGCHVFLAQISATKEDEKSKGKQVKDVPIIQDFPKVFPEDLP
nr:putative reverse transcriptase domain-containing protein [Tanacetum cinerariifolium]